jgi:predicted phosphodiesterase
MCELQAYLQGALHDGTRNSLHHTHRFSQKGTDWLIRLGEILAEMGHRSWSYREGKDRDVFVLETSAGFLDIDFDPDSLQTESERIAYVRGYFDAEGGLPRSAEARFYVQFTQKDRVELGKVKQILEQLDICCGVIHNPSVRVDPDYWRFFVRANSYRRFALVIGSWHPRKEPILRRMMI